ncbi:DUF423 domain-containing protein [Rhizobium binae]|uniref:DUF423 domain-containing protein n=1 Tax=Rhizobium binae TaxID=1138190 RepID=UPI001C83A182|nr:DUF423 domain-containing protein [Rhizobium binae]MBX4969927.1 DUF423 domain-containing protein [Rhizobium binae]
MSLNARLEPVLYLFAGLFGAAGVALAALAAHGGGQANLPASASAMCLAHAPALLALALGTTRLKTAWLAGFLMIVGTLLFAGDLVTLQFTAASLFPYAAPIGGWAMMLGWLAVAAGAGFRVRA